ncbi:hypothetical protein LP420_13165 [Massilia sp. B-10]|nr:hypothetical protein LP420_13165 [Massilia sp. B-10]
MIWATTESGSLPPSVVASVAPYREEVISARAHFDAAFQFRGRFLGDELVAVTYDRKLFGRVVAAVDDGRAQPLQFAVLAGLRLDAFARLELHHAAGDFVGFDEVDGLGVVDAEALQQDRQRVAWADFFFLDEALIVFLQGCNLIGQIRHDQILRDGSNWQVRCVRSHRRTCMAPKAHAARKIAPALIIATFALFLAGRSSFCL